MIRQAHTYLAGAISGTALIGAAVVAFVVLVSVQALRDWPLAGIGGGGEVALDESRPVAPQGAIPAGAGTAGLSGQAAGREADRRGGDAQTRRQGGNSALGVPASAGAEAPGSAPVSEPTGGGAAPGNSPAPSSSSSSNPAGGGGSGSSPGTSGSGGGSSGQSTSGAVTGTVNETVSGVDGALGGPLGEAGVTEATENAVNGLAGPESTVGKTVDDTVKAVGGLLGGNQ